MLNFLIILILFFSNAYADSEFTQIDIIIKNHQFQPEQIEAPAGIPLRLTIYNQDDTIEEFDSPDLKREKIIPGNSFANIKLAPLKIGKYCFVGEFHADTAKGCLIIK